MQAQIAQHARDQILQRVVPPQHLGPGQQAAGQVATSATGSAAPCARPPDTARSPMARSTTARGGGRPSCAAQDREPSGTIPCCRPPEQSAPVPPRRRWPAPVNCWWFRNRCQSRRDVSAGTSHSIIPPGACRAPAERPRPERRPLPRTLLRGRSGGHCRVPYCAAGAAAIAAYPTARPERRPLPRTLLRGWNTSAAAT